MSRIATMIHPNEQVLGASEKHDIYGNRIVETSRARKRATRMSSRKVDSARSKRSSHPLESQHSTFTQKRKHRKKGNAVNRFGI